ncbi:hypothetical protein [Rossellomorea marisflavi]|uniref:hypothetical protein n=1 Tax=Rossellomorea marisflavi TaxID=189381 RepID=UPI003FA12A54
MKIHLPTTLEVQIDDPDLLQILKNKSKEMLQGADFAEQDKETSEYWLWKDNSNGKPSPEHPPTRVREISRLEFDLLDSISSSIYHLNKLLNN